MVALDALRFKGFELGCELVPAGREPWLREGGSSRPAPLSRAEEAAAKIANGSDEYRRVRNHAPDIRPMRSGEPETAHQARVPE